MREQFIIGNWKMHGDKTLVKGLLNGLKAAYSHPDAKVQIVVCPPYIFLQQTQELLQHSKIAWGAQNVAAERNGAYTGEISVSMLLEFACQYVLLGHSERRTLFKETDAQIGKKFKLSVESGIRPILCIGETFAQRSAAQTESVLEQQIKTILTFDKASLQKAILAYEPVWAIGTGQVATPEQAQSVHQFLRQQIANVHPDLAQKLPILYGGSVKASNAKALFQMPDIDGGLIGGASLQTDEFLQIYEDCVSVQ
jgi:triosephosphate isomerase (TIM)